MKKIVLSLAGVMAAVAFAPEASAVPVFARQTGMACSACHYQHFPLLNGFGRSFKASGFTLMGAQGKVEDEHLSIPDRVNMGVLATTFMQFQSNNNLAAAPARKWGTPGTGGELSIFFGGKISDFAGFLAELGMNQGAAAGIATATAGVAAAKLPILVEVADGTRAGLVVHSSNGQGVAYSFELLNTGAANTHKLMGNPGPTNQHVRATSAAQYLNTNTAATGISLVAVNSDVGFVNIGKYAPAGNAGANTGANTLPMTYVRAAGMFDVAGFDSAVGIQNFSGNATALGIAASHKATVIDGQMQGDLGGMPVGFYASYGTASADAVNANAFTVGVGTGKTTSFNVAGEVGVLPGHATLQLALRQAKQASGLTDNAVMVGGVYDLAMNVALTLHYTTQSGSAWNAANAVGKTATTLLLETLF